MIENFTARAGVMADRAIFDRQRASIVIAYTTAFNSEVLGDGAIAYHSVGDVQVEAASATPRSITSTTLNHYAI